MLLAFLITEQQDLSLSHTHTHRVILECEQEQSRVCWTRAGLIVLGTMCNLRGPCSWTHEAETEIEISTQDV